MRGEREDVTPRVLRKGGSSPQTRGMRDDLHLQAVLLRFIPACAGNARAWTCAKRSHPGSSPHARGTLRGGDRMRGHTRFIPAYAGNASPRRLASSKGSVHPRVCGEREKHNRVQAERLGSSPRRRGTHGVYGKDTRCSRFIPAYAGNAWPSGSHRSRGPVHPRIRGERYFSSSGRRESSGSSPHTRGTQGDWVSDTEKRRFIPAYAGNAYSPRS